MYNGHLYANNACRFGRRKLASNYYLRFGPPPPPDVRPAHPSNDDRTKPVHVRRGLCRCTRAKTAVIVFTGNDGDSSVCFIFFSVPFRRCAYTVSEKRLSVYDPGDRRI